MAKKQSSAATKNEDREYDNEGVEVKDSKSDPHAVQFADDFEDMALPDDSSLITGDVEGYWDPEKTAIRCMPLSVKLFDGNIDSRKPAILIIAELVLPCKIAYKAEADDKEWSYRKAKPGTMVGIWYKPGMRGIVCKAGVDCYIKLTEDTKDTGKGNPMKIYEVRAGAGGTRIPMSEDVRHKSARATTDFDVRRLPKAPSRRVEEDVDDGDDDDFVE
jgi:hypothetical protein